ncbi:MAG: DUF1501 domain-containing protein [Planctomycetota bacterium]|nr:MAG: DUF1501 domain-containing protein [Planctomycetota bacterium]
MNASRREFLQQGCYGFGAMAFAALLARDLPARLLAAPPPRRATKARHVIFLHMAGSPSQLDLFDPKPKLVQWSGKACPDEYLRNERFAFIKGTPKMLGSPYAFAPRGRSGQVISELLPRLHSIADDIAIVRSMRTTQFNHAPAQIFMNTGHERMGRPSMGAWVSYGIGSANQNLPGYVVLLSGRYAPDGGASLWGSGFLPTGHQGVRLRSGAEPVLYLGNPPGMDAGDRRRSLDALEQLNGLALQQNGDPEIRTRMDQYELAFRMQMSVPELADLSQEPPETLAMYGVEPGQPSYAGNCLLARRLIERGVRFVELYHWGWDSHGTNAGDDIVHSLPERCRETDQATVALVADLKRMGLLDETLIVWGGEFGRTPMNEERDGSKFLGRDHHPHCFTIWLAGGGIKPGITIGATDEFGYLITEDPVEVHDLHATMLHLLGLDHLQLTYKFMGRDFRLTDVSGVVVDKLLA